MYCYQCEQTAKGIACTVAGACGKDAVTAALQDLLLHATMGISSIAHRARNLGLKDREIDAFTIESLFATVTNVNFDPARLQGLVRRASALRDRASGLYEEACRKAGFTPGPPEGIGSLAPAEDLEGMARQGEDLSPERRREKRGADVTGLQDMLAYSLKGAAAYAHQARDLGKEDDNLYAGFHEALSFLGEEDTTTDDLFRMCLESGRLNLRAMELLDAANTEVYGHPVPTAVRLTPVKGKAILVSGHNLKDLGALLEQTQGTGINVYTHGEMLPAHGYPRLKAYAHLAGNHGSAWQNQAVEFDRFPGAILMTTNCIQKPRDTYRDRIFTAGLVAWPGVRHIADRDFTPVIEAALSAPGFSANGPKRTITVGFGHRAVLGIADKVIEAVRKGKIRHFFLIGGCDGAKSERSYYTELAQAIPRDCVILTLACGKYRFNQFEFGDIAGIPRLLDIGQCNDTYSAVQIALALANAFGCGVNDLPLSLVLSWYEQKAVAVLLTLLSLGIRNIRLGPSLPAFLTPNILKVLSQKYNIMPIGTPFGDLAAILGDGGLEKVA